MVTHMYDLIRRRQGEAIAFARAVSDADRFIEMYGKAIFSAGSDSHKSTIKQIAKRILERELPSHEDVVGELKRYEDGDTTTTLGQYITGLIEMMNKGKADLEKITQMEEEVPQTK